MIKPTVGPGCLPPRSNYSDCAATNLAHQVRLGSPGPRPALCHRCRQGEARTGLATERGARTRAGADSTLVFRKSSMVGTTSPEHLSGRAAWARGRTALNVHEADSRCGQVGAVGLLPRGIGSPARDPTGRDGGRPELDLEDARSVERAARAVKPSAMVNAAAYTAVDRAESEPQ